LFYILFRPRYPYFVSTETRTPVPLPCAILATTFTMTAGKRVSDDLAWTIVRLSAVHPPSDIAHFTELHIRTVQKILKYFHETGRIKPLVDPRDLPRKRHLKDEEVAVSLLMIDYRSWCFFAIQHVLTSSYLDA
jgi:hypothetical protein